MVEVCLHKISLLNRKAKPGGVAEVVSPGTLIRE
jgi:hypothetical protein